MCFWGESGPILGYMVTERGLEVNPDEVKAIQDMKTPNNIKEVQTLTGRIAALSHFLSRVAEKSFPFFKILRKGNRFEWSVESEVAFNKFKVVLSKLPILFKPKEGEKLHVYLSLGSRVVSSVMLREEKWGQLPVYYASKLLRRGGSRILRDRKYRVGAGHGNKKA